MYRSEVTPPETCDTCGADMRNGRCSFGCDEDELAEMEAMDRYYESKFSDR